MRYTGPKARINRRYDTLLFESAGATKAYEKRNTPPGMHTRRPRPSTYGLGLYEKQKIKYYYGLTEKQLRRFYDKAKRAHGNTGQNLISLCERRLDNVVRRAGLTKTRPQARQGIAHGHFLVNGRKVTIASFLVRPGDKIQVRNREKLMENYKQFMTESATQQPDFLGVDNSEMSITVLGLPGPGDESLRVDVNMVVEFMSR